MSPSPLAIIRINVCPKAFSRVNYARRMYAIVRRYTPEATEGGINEVYANLTGLRTFFKMTYRELMENIVQDLEREIGIEFITDVSTEEHYVRAKKSHRAERSLSTYKELNGMFAGKRFAQARDKRGMFTSKKKLSLPFLGKVA